MMAPRDQGGMGIVLTQMCSSRRGTDCMSRFTRLVSYLSSVHNNTDQIVQQVLQQCALDVAETYHSDQHLWITAAKNLRAPYWDWTTDTVPPPEVVSLRTVNNDSTSPHLMAIQPLSQIRCSITLSTPSSRRSQTLGVIRIRQYGVLCHLAV